MGNLTTTPYSIRLSPWMTFFFKQPPPPNLFKPAHLRLHTEDGWRSATGQVKTRSSLLSNSSKKPFQLFCQQNIFVKLFSSQEDVAMSEISGGRRAENR